jgi:3-oxoacyl-[acyl-carrier-protein] synthase-3
MGAIIKATGTSTDPGIKSSIEHAVAAARDCIKNAAIDLEQIDLLINVGVYRDDNMVEPAMAALIQKGLGLGRDYVKYPTPKPTISFDVMNGACGLLNAVQVASGFLATGADYALIVSSDAHPSNRAVSGFPYAPLGAAMLLERGARDGAGFGRLHVRASDGDFVGVKGYLEIEKAKADGRNQITIDEQEGYKERLLDHVIAQVKEYVAAEGIALDKTLLVTSQPTPDFGARIAKRLDVPAQSAVHIPGIDLDPHSSALTLGYHRALATGQDKSFEQILFVAAGAGLTSACTLYRH